MTTEPTPRRRRLETPGEDTGNRAGCLFLGATLGIIVGIMFALYGLPPILRAIYGEEDVAADEAYEGDGRLIRVLRVEREPDPERFVVSLDVTNNKTWDLAPEDFQLEITTEEDWIPALPPGDDPDTSLDFTLGQQRTLVLVFEAPTRVDARPVALHLADPRVRFDLEGLLE